MHLTLSTLEQAGVYSHSIQSWRDRAEMDCTWINFCPHFIHTDKERLRLATTGYHAAHAAIQTSGTPPPPGIAAAACAVPSGYSYNNVQLGYCWTPHGLTKNPEHTSTTCNHPASGHQITATLDRRMGGSIRIFSDGTRPARPSRVSPQPSTHA